MRFFRKSHHRRWLESKIKRYFLEYFRELYSEEEGDMYYVNIFGIGVTAIEFKINRKHGVEMIITLGGVELFEKSREAVTIYIQRRLPAAFKITTKKSVIWE